MKFAKTFLVPLAERAAKTFAQSFLAVLLATHAVGLTDVSWGQDASVAGLAALLSILTSVASLGGPGKPTPSA